VVEKSLVR